MSVPTETFDFDENVPSTSLTGMGTVQTNGERDREGMRISKEFLDDGTENETDDDEYWTSAELFRELVRIFLDETAAPKLLPEKLDIVEKLLIQTNEIEGFMARNSNKKSLAFSAHKMELYRIEFLINSYLRARLKKIEQNPAKALHEHSERLRRALAALRAGKSTDEHPELLDRRELRYAEQLQTANSTLFANSFLNHLPPSMQWLPIALGNSAEQSRVFIEVLQDGLEDVPVPSMADPNSEMLISLEKGSRHLMPFHSIQHLLECGHHVFPIWAQASSN